MGIIGSVRDFLLSSPAVANAVGKRITPQASTQGRQTPRITYFLVSRDDGITSDGPTGPIGDRYQLDCWDEDYDRATDLREAVRDARGGEANGPILHGFKGRMGVYTVQGAWLENWREDYEDAVDGSDKGLHRASTELVIWYERP